MQRIHSPRPAVSCVGGLLLILAVLAGCAQVVPQPVANFQDPKGIPYYGGSYYLLIYPDGKGNIAWTLEYAMDPLQKMEYRTDNMLATTTATLTFSNGLLTDAVTTSDSSALIQTITTAVKTVASALANENRAGHTVGAPRVYKVVPKSGGIDFVGQGENGGVVIRAPITSQEAPKKDAAGGAS